MAEQGARTSSALFDVYLRLRPSPVPCAERFLDVEDAGLGRHPTHITIKPPANDHRKRAIEKFEFTKVFEEQASQLDLFKSTEIPAVIEAVLGKDGGQGRDGLLATLGVTGSGKVCWRSLKVFETILRLCRVIPFWDQGHSAA